MIIIGSFAFIFLFAPSLGWIVLAALPLYALDSGEITYSGLNMMPFSINHLLDASKYPELAYTTLGKFSIFEFGWCYILYMGLVSIGKIKKDHAALLIFAIWMLLLLFQWGLAAYFQGMNA